MKTNSYKQYNIRVWFSDGSVRYFSFPAIDFNAALADIKSAYTDEIDRYQYSVDNDTSISHITSSYIHELQYHNGA